MSPRYNAGVGPLSLAEFEQMPEHDYFREELSRGWLIREPPPGGEQGCVSGNLHFMLRTFVSGGNLGRVLMETGFRLSEHPPTVRAPDVAFVTAARLGAEVPTGFWTFAPDLAVEVVSPGNRPKDIELELADYLEAGTAEVWVVQPRKRTVLIHRANGNVRTVRENDSLTSDLLPGFSLPLEDVFRL